MKKKNAECINRVRIHALSVLILLLMMAGCDNVTSPDTSTNVHKTEQSLNTSDALNTISDGVHGGTEGFYFLPPMVKSPDYSGVFDGSLSPVVEICKTTACSDIHASYSTTKGTGSEVVRLDEEDEHYIVNWHTGETGAVAGQTYRVRVVVSSVVLGHADVAVVSTGREAVAVRSDGSIALVANQTLPVKFRIETGVVGGGPSQPIDLAIVPSTITAGAEHMCGLDVNGNAYCWGRNWYGELGNGTTTSSNTPVAVTMPTGESFVAISAGESHTVALTAAGAAYAWGSNYNGLLGDGTTTDRTTPVPVSMPIGESFASIAAGEYHTLALTTTGVAYGWGFNWDGQLGDGTTTDSGTLVAVAMPAGVTFTAISAGREHSVALTAAGVAYGWGANWDGQLGNGTTTSSSTPVPASMPTGESFTAISAGFEHTAALTTGGTAYVWGNTGTEADSPTPVAVPTPTGEMFAAISAGQRYTLALTASGIAYAWGFNWQGQLGDGTTTQRNTPVAVDTEETFAAISAALGGFNSVPTVAITTAGAAYAWGRNHYGLGDGTNTVSTTPVLVSGGITFAY